MEKVLLKAFAKITGKSVNELTDIISTKSEDGESQLNENAFELLTELDSTRIDAIKTGVKTKAYDVAYIEAKKKVLLEAEKNIGELLGVDFEGKKLKDIVTDGLSVNAKLKDVKKSPEYLELENRFTTRETELQADFDSKLQAFQKESRYKDTLNNARKKALATFTELNPVLPVT